MKPFAPPTPKLAARILGEVGFADRLIGHRMRRRVGPAPVSLYSFEEVVRFLAEQALQLDLEELRAWVAEKIGDEDLAWAIGEVADRDMDDFEKLQHVRALMAARIAQARRIARLA